MMTKEEQEISQQFAEKYIRDIESEILQLKKVKKLWQKLYNNESYPNTQSRIKIDDLDTKSEKELIKIVSEVPQSGERYGSMLYHLITFQNNNISIQNKIIEILKYFIVAKGVNVNLPTIYNQTFLNAALESPHIKVVKYLLSIDDIIVQENDLTALKEFERESRFDITIAMLKSKQSTSLVKSIIRRLTLPSQYQWGMLTKKQQGQIRQLLHDEEKKFLETRVRDAELQPSVKQKLMQRNYAAKFNFKQYNQLKQNVNKLKAVFQAGETEGLDEKNINTSLYPSTFPSEKSESEQLSIQQIATANNELSKKQQKEELSRLKKLKRITQNLISKLKLIIWNLIKKLFKRQRTSQNDSTEGDTEGGVVLNNMRQIRSQNTNNTRSDSFWSSDEKNKFKNNNKQDQGVEA